MDALDLFEEARVDAFCELYGYWLLHGSWHPNAVLFQPLEEVPVASRSWVEAISVERLLRQVGLSKMRSRGPGTEGYRVVQSWERSDFETAEQFQRRKEGRLLQIEVPAALWVQYFGELYGGLKPAPRRRDADWPALVRLQSQTQATADSDGQQRRHSTRQLCIGAGCIQAGEQCEDAVSLGVAAVRASTAAAAPWPLSG